MKARYKAKQLRELMRQPGVAHPIYGDLLHPRAVTQGKPLRKGVSYRENNPPYIHLSITSRCNARCQGCINSLIESPGKKATFEDTNPKRDAKAITEIIRRSRRRDAVICLYGGEPLLQPKKIAELMAELDHKSNRLRLRYMLYTNGDLLGNVIRLSPEVIRRLWLVSVSIDGSYKQHAAVRRGSDLKRIEANLTALKKASKAYVLMWSTLRESQSLWDCFEEFMKLYKKGSVGYFFWHWVETPQPFADLSAYLHAYETDLRRIMDVYVAYLKKGRVLPITHINELLLYFFSGRKRGTTACAVEEPGNYDIVAGRIYACADLPQRLAIGRIDKKGSVSLRDPDLSGLTKYKDDLGCARCGVEFFCGGRCPVEAFTTGVERLLEYCQLMRLHVGVVKEYAPVIWGLLKKNRIGLQAIYDKIVLFNQFTDVTP